MTQKPALPLLVEPSILSADAGKLTDEVKQLEQVGVDGIHIDIMDGHFVPNLTFGSRTVAAIRRHTSLFLDVHLMIYNPYDYIERFVEAGADRITIHFEATEDVEDTLNYIRKCRVEAGLAFCPETSESMIPKYLNKCDLMLLMTVNPGFGGQAFMPQALDKIRFTRDLCHKMDIRKGGKVPQEDSPQEVRNLPGFFIQVDGGINDQTAAECIEAGANVLVSGSYIFKSVDKAKAIESLKKGKKA